MGTYTTYANQCSTQTVHEPVQQCYTSYTTQCYHARSKRGTKKENKEKNNQGGNQGGNQGNGVQCRQVPQQHCTQSSRSRNVETCHQVPQQSQREECQQVPQQTCNQVPSKTCNQVAVNRPVRQAKRVCY